MQVYFYPLKECYLGVHFFYKGFEIGLIWYNLVVEWGGRMKRCNYPEETYEEESSYGLIVIAFTVLFCLIIILH